MRSFRRGISIDGDGGNGDVFIVGQLTESGGYLAQLFQVVAQFGTDVPTRDDEVEMCLTADGAFFADTQIGRQVAERKISVTKGEHLCLSGQTGQHIRHGSHATGPAGIPAEFPNERHAVLPNEIIVAATHGPYAVKLTFAHPDQPAVQLQSKFLRQGKMKRQVTSQSDGQRTLLGRDFVMPVQRAGLCVELLQVNAGLHQQRDRLFTPFGNARKQAVEVEHGLQRCFPITGFTVNL